MATARLPLGSYADRRSFKVYSLDIGLLGALAGTAPQLLVHGDDLFAEYRGAPVENYVAQQLAAASGAAPGTPATAGGLYFWRSTGGMAEVGSLAWRRARHELFIGSTHLVRAGTHTRRSCSRTTSAICFSSPKIACTNVDGRLHSSAHGD